MFSMESGVPKKVTPSGVGVSENRAMFQFLEPKKNPFSHHFPIMFPIVWINTYENTIFRGLFTSILTQLFWCEQKGYYWFWHTAISYYDDYDAIIIKKKHIFPIFSHMSKAIWRRTSPSPLRLPKSARTRQIWWFANGASMVRPLQLVDISCTLW